MTKTDDPAVEMSAQDRLFLVECALRTYNSENYCHSAKD